MGQQILSIYFLGVRHGIFKDPSIKNYKKRICLAVPVTDSPACEFLASRLDLFFFCMLYFIYLLVYFFVPFSHCVIDILGST